MRAGVGFHMLSNEDTRWTRYRNRKNDGIRTAKARYLHIKKRWAYVRTTEEGAPTVKEGEKDQPTSQRSEQVLKLRRIREIW